jgi:uridine kinase
MTAGPSRPRSAIAVEGLDGSGKSRFAAALAAALTAAGRPAALVHVDDFRRTLDFEGLAPGEETALYYDRYFDFARAGAALATELAGPPDGTIAILEGVMVLRAGLPTGTPLLMLTVSPEEARRRIAARDEAKGRTPEEIARRIERRYFPAHARYCAAFHPQGQADLVVDNEDWLHPRVVRRRDGRLPPEVASVLDRLLAPG